MSGLIEDWGKDADLLGYPDPGGPTITLTASPNQTNWNLETLGTLTVTGLGPDDYIEIVTPGFAATEA